MRLIYAGTPDFAVPALETLIAAGHDVLLVLTQPDRPAGRGLRAAISPVKHAALRHGIAVYQSTTLSTEAARAPLRDANADAMVVAAYGLILPQAVLDLSRRGAFNIHASLLPRWRGAAPIQRAILAGDRETGVCIMRMEAGLDTGPVLLRESIAIEATDTGGSVHDKLSALGAKMIVPAVSAYVAGSLQPQQQSAEGVTYASKIAKAEARVDWTQSAVHVDRHLRAFDPMPGSVSRIADVDLKLWRGRPMEAAGDAAPGTILSVDENGILVACGKGAFLLTELQRPGAKRLSAKEFLRGFKVEVGERFAGSND
ncbi:MAG TPA: methionyl-tRNA formyltransferase [Burkholderiales bacterium]|nr:methionyl-tRNA formyltransferase [Burkholderiales bacterium]